MSEIIIREYTEKDLPEMVRVWNEIIEAGIYFDYDEILTVDYVRGWFAEQTAVRELYAKLGFTQIGTIPGGLQIKGGSYVNTCPYYIEL